MLYQAISARWNLVETFLQRAVGMERSALTREALKGMRGDVQGYNDVRASNVRGRGIICMDIHYCKFGYCL